VQPGNLLVGDAVRRKKNGGGETFKHIIAEARTWSGGVDLQSCKIRLLH
jgi:hypothetical protein